MELTDSRRLTRPSLILDRPGAAAEISVPQDVRDRAASLWSETVRALLDALGWQDEQIATRVHAGGASLAITAPIDCLFAATEIVEAAWDAAIAELSGDPMPDHASELERLKDEIEAETNPAFRALYAAASAHNVACLFDEDQVTFGLGRTSQSWPMEALPAPQDIDWSAISNRPAALVTGTNGKSTTVRMAAAIGEAAGLTVGFSTSDWVRVGSDTIAKGDYSGPEGARLALRDPRVDLAVIEAARGGLLRRGLPLPTADACLITNIAADHLGEYGIHDIDGVTDTKFMIAKAVENGGTLILNADDARLRARAESFSGKIVWYGLTLRSDEITDDTHAAFIEDDHFVLAQSGHITRIAPVDAFGPALGGAARYNMSNALGAILLMSVLGVEPGIITKGLLSFESTPEDNPGRGNFTEVGGVKVIVDFAHNPHGLRALSDALNAVPAKRRLYLCGQAGDRSDDDIFAMTKVIRDSQPDAIIVRGMPSKLRGREPGEVPALIHDYLTQMDYAEDQIQHAPTEIDAVIKAFEWAQPGDLLVLLIVEKRAEPLALIERLKSDNWAPGQPIPT